MNHYTLHSLDTGDVRRLTLEAADKRYIVAANAEDLGHKLAEHAPGTPSIRLDNHCEQYLPADVVQRIMCAYDRAKVQEQVKVK